MDRGLASGDLWCGNGCGVFMGGNLLDPSPGPSPARGGEKTVLVPG